MSCFLLPLEDLARAAYGKEKSLEEEGLKTADFWTLFFVTLFFFKLNILSTGELETDKATLVEAKAGPKVEMLSSRPKIVLMRTKKMKII